MIYGCLFRTSPPDITYFNQLGLDADIGFRVLLTQRFQHF